MRNSLHKLIMVAMLTAQSSGACTEVGGQNPSSRAPRAPDAPVPDSIRRAQEENATDGKAPMASRAVNGEDMQLRDWVTNRIWATKLGRMFSEYLFGVATPEENIRKVHRLVDRVFENVYLSMSRYSGLQLMMEDLFNTGRLDPVVNDRLGLLNLNISLKRHALEVRAAHEINWQLPVIGAVGVLAGSRLVRNSVASVIEVVKTNARWFILRDRAAEARAARAAVGAINASDLITWNKIFDSEYSTGKAVATAAGAFLFYTPLYFQARAGSADSASPALKVVIYGVEQLLNLSVL